MSVFLALVGGVMATAMSLTMTACDGNKKPKAETSTAEQQLEAKREVTPVTTTPAEHFRGKDGPNSTGGPPTTTTNGQ